MDALALGGLQGIDLQVVILFVGRGSGVADLQIRHSLVIASRMVSETAEGG